MPLGGLLEAGLPLIDVAHSVFVDLLGESRAVAEHEEEFDEDEERGQKKGW